MPDKKLWRIKKVPRGGKRPGAGRPRGAISKSTRAILEAAAAHGEMPLDYMLRVMRDPDAPAARRDEMAKAAAPYLHARLQPAPDAALDEGPVVPVLNVTIARPADFKPEPAQRRIPSRELSARCPRS